MPLVFKLELAHARQTAEERTDRPRQRPTGILRRGCSVHDGSKCVAFGGIARIWSYPRNSAAFPQPHFFIFCLQGACSVLVYFLSVLFWTERYRVVLWERPMKLVREDIVCAGILHDFELDEDMEGDLRRANEFAFVRKISRLNKMDDVLDDDNLADGFFGSRIGVFGPDPSKWVFSNEQVAQKWVPELVPEIKLTLKRRTLKPFFELWHDFTFCQLQKESQLQNVSAESFDHPRHEDNKSASFGLNDFFAQLNDPFLQSNSEHSENSPPSESLTLAIKPPLQPQSLCSVPPPSDTEGAEKRKSLPNIKVLRSSRSLLVDEAEAMLVVKKHWHAAHFNRAKRNLFEGLEEELLREERYGARCAPLEDQVRSKQSAKEESSKKFDWMFMAEEDEDGGFAECIEQVKLFMEEMEDAKHTSSPACRQSRRVSAFSNASSWTAGGSASRGSFKIARQCMEKATARQ